jgi:hypothetical protein
MLRFFRRASKTRNESSPARAQRRWNIDLHGLDVRTRRLLHGLRGYFP